MLQLGWKAGTEQYPPAELLEYAIAPEDAGFDFIDASDHFHPWAEKGQACFVWSWLGAVAAKTNKIITGTGVTCPTLRYHPAIIDQAAATVACFAPGRFYLGVGTGEALNEYSATAQWPGYKVRQNQLAEAIELIRALWSGEKVTHKGLYYQTRQAKLYTRPREPLPVYISSMVPNSARFAGKYGDGLITVGGEEPETYRKIFENLEAGAREAGKDPSWELAVDYTDEKKSDRVQASVLGGNFYTSAVHRKNHTPRMSEENGKVVGSDTVRQSVCISADPKTHVEFAQQYIDLGFDHLFFHSAGPDQRAFLQGYGRDVLPQLRQLDKARVKSVA